MLSTPGCFLYVPGLVIYQQQNVEGRYELFGHQLVLKHKQSRLQELSDDQTRYEMSFENINRF